MTITASIRLQCERRDEAEQVKAWLEGALGDAVQLAAPAVGRSGVWFVRGTLRVNAQQQAEARPKTTTVEEIDRQFGNARRLVDAVIRHTGQVVQVPDPEDVPTDAAQTTRLARLTGLSRPETQPDGVNRRELHERSREIKEQHNDERSDLPLV